MKWDEKQIKSVAQVKKEIQLHFDWKKTKAHMWVQGTMLCNETNQ